MSNDTASITQIIVETDDITGGMLAKLRRLEMRLHETGYHHYSANVSNLANKIERAYSSFVDEMMDA